MQYEEFNAEGTEERSTEKRRGLLYPLRFLPLRPLR